MDPLFKSEDSNIKLYHGDCLEIMPWLEEASIDMIYADPPYFLSNGGVTCNAGQMVSVDKGEWDKQRSPYDIHEFNIQWLKQCSRLLKSDGTIWISGTQHNIYSVGHALQCLGFKVLNDITWKKINPPPNLSCRYFTHSHEHIIWAAKNEQSKHLFNYADMKIEAGGKQMKSVWEMGPPKKIERKAGHHPTQKPEALLNRIIKASTVEGNLILDPFAGSGTTVSSAIKLKRKFIGIELDKKYIDLTIERIK
jgi:site-specific DNA-methyltransferase (adenine-specific)